MMKKRIWRMLYSLFFVGLKFKNNKTHYNNKNILAYSVTFWINICIFAIPNIFVVNNLYIFNINIV